MKTYYVYRASDDKYLGKVQADHLREAEREAERRWTTFEIRVRIA